MSEVDRCPFVSLPLPSDTVSARSLLWRQSDVRVPSCMSRAKKQRVEKETRTILRGFFQDQILGKLRFLITSSSKKAVHCYPRRTQFFAWYICAEFVKTSDRIAVYKARPIGFARNSLQDFTQWITVFERGLAICLQKKIRERQRSEGAAIRTSNATSERNHDTGTSAWSFASVYRYSLFFASSLTAYTCVIQFD